MLDELDTVEEAIEAHRVDLDSLDNEQVIEHHLYRNSEAIQMPELSRHQSLCFKPFPVPSRTTLDFSASLLCTPGAAPLTERHNTAVANMSLLNQSGERVAVARHETGNHPEDAYLVKRSATTAVSSLLLTHTEKVEADTAFTFCV